MKNPCRTSGQAAALIVVLTVLAYLPALRNGFVFDDAALITDNKLIKASDGLYRFWFTTEPPDYYPLTWSLWWLEWRLWDASATGYHVVNVLLHAASTVLVWLVLRRLKIPGAWLAALVFAVHPVNVATVAWISEQKNTLSMLFYALAILLYLRFDEDHEWQWYGLSLIAFLLALLSKTAVVMLPVVLLACMWWQHNRVRQNDLMYSLPYFAASFVFGLVTIWFQSHRVLHGTAVRTVGFPSRLAAAGWIPWFYLYKALLPVNLTMLYRKWAIDPSRLVSFVPGILLIGGFVLFWWKRKSWGRPFLFGLGCFVATLFPVLGFFDQGFYRGSLVADHWQYYAIVSVIALAVAMGAWICRRLGEHSRSAQIIAGAAVVLVLGAGTWKRSFVYANDETLWQDNVTKNPSAWLAHYNLGVALGKVGQVPAAIGEFEQALSIEPNFAEAHYNLGNALSEEGQFEEAIRHWKQAVSNEPDDVDALYNLGVTFMRLGKLEEAVDAFEQALKSKPDFAEARANRERAKEIERLREPGSSSQR